LIPCRFLKEEQVFRGLLSRPSHRFLAAFVALTLMPTAGLVWAGWLLIQRDRNLERDRIQKHRDEALPLIATALRQAIDDTRRQLADSAAWPRLVHDDAFIVVVESEDVRTIPATPLLYYPVQPRLPHAVEAVNYLSETDLEKLRRLTRSQSPAVRAGAAVRLAMLLRIAGRAAEALDVYAQLATEEGITVTDNPSDLVARIARCDVLATLNHESELRREAEQLELDLNRSRWRLDGANYDHYADEVAHWLGRNPPARDSRRLVAEKLASLWEAGMDAAGKRPDAQSIGLGEQSVTLIPGGSGDRLAVLVAGQRYLQQVWLAPLAPLLADANLQLTLMNAGDRPVFGEVVQGAFTSRRSSVQTGLPWNVLVTAASPDQAGAQADARARLYLAGLGVILVGMALGSFLVARALKRELAVARLQSEFVAAVSHELRTPLTSLRQSAESLAEGRQPGPEHLHSYYQVQMRATERLQRLVESLLDFGRMEARAKAYRKESFGLAEWTRRIVDEFRCERAWSDHRLEYRGLCDNGSVAMIHGDPEALARALRNLVDNAVKYSPGREAVWVEAGRQGRRLTLSVRDEGFGIPASERKQIFRKFVRGAASKTHGIKGTGIGLAMVEQIVRAHDGEIHLDSQPGVGSTFTIVLPQARS
jgi:signal transduction histidine kinase